MSRIGNLEIIVPENIIVDFDEIKNLISVKSSKGILYQKINKNIKIVINNNKIILLRNDSKKYVKSLHGLYRSLINNMIIGVTKGFTIKQELIGIGYKANTINNILFIDVGHSHDFVFKMPKEVTVNTINKKGEPFIITLNSIDKQLLGQIAAKIRKLRKPEPYKGKGIRFYNEKIKIKAIKSSSKK